MATDAQKEAFAGSPLQEIPVRLTDFEGPLDLLLHLIRESKVDILDIPVAKITEQYLAYLDVMRTLNLEIAGEFLVVAATLLHIKSRMLLPVPETEEGEQGEDPRRDLVQQLIEYQKFKEAGLALRELEEARARAFTRESLGPAGDPRQDYPLDVSLFDLVAAMRRVIEALPQGDRVEIEPETFSVTQRIAELLELLAPGREVPFEELFRGAREVGDVVVTFLALLELVRLRLVRARQTDAFGQIHVMTVPGGEEGGVGGSPAAPAEPEPGAGLGLETEPEADAGEEEDDRA